MILKIKILIILFLASYIINAQPVKFSNEFLSIGVGARSLAMGKSNMATTNDVYSGYWNPSALMNLRRDIEIGVMHQEDPNGISNYDFAGAMYKIDSLSTAGISAIRFGVDNIPNTLNLYDRDGNIDYNRISYFSVADYGFLLSYARKSPIKGLNYGGNIKIIHRVIGEFAKAWGFGFDASAQYNYKNWTFAAMGRDITSTFNAWSVNTSQLEEPFALTGNELPSNSLEITIPRLIVGIARNQQIFKRFSIIAEIDADVTFDGKRNELIKSNLASISPHMGLEMNYDHVAFFRMGAGNIYKNPSWDGNNYYSFQPNFGVGIRFYNFDIDYALTDFMDKTNNFYSHVFSISLSINKIKGLKFN